MDPFKVLISGLTFTECPRWHNGRLYISDFYSHQVLAVDLQGASETIAEVPHQPAGLGFLPDGRMLIVSMLDHKVLIRQASGELRVHADLAALAPGPLNDMLVDPDGRAFVGNFGFDLFGGGAPCNTVLFCIEPDGCVHVAAEDLGFPNGMALTPDRRTLIVAETTQNRLSAFAVDGGRLGPRRTWASFGDPPTATDVPGRITQLAVAADGICLDAEGAVWVADAIHGRLIRVAEGGHILDELSTTEGQFYACALGGEDGRTLFACHASGPLDPASFARRRSASVRMARVEVAGAGWI